MCLNTLMAMQCSGDPNRTSSSTKSHPLERLLLLFLQGHLLSLFYIIIYIYIYIFKINSLTESEDPQVSRSSLFPFHPQSCDISVCILWTRTVFKWLPLQKLLFGNCVGIFWYHICVRVDFVDLTCWENVYFHEKSFEICIDSSWRGVWSSQSDPVWLTGCKNLITFY